MASSIFYPLSASPLPLIDESTSKSSFLHGTKLSSRGPSFTARRAKRSVTGRGYRSPSMSLNHIPKQFREENLKDGLMDNYKNAPQYLYGLTPSQIDMFMTEDNPVRRQSEIVTEESISSAKNYLDNGGMWSLSGMGDKGPAQCSMSVSMYRGGARGYGRPRTAPPDLPSLLLDARICYLGMPIVPEVTELLVAQFMWLDYDNPSKPIYLYINSSGTQDDKMETVGSETEAYAIADMMAYVKADVYTVNCGMAYGQAAMLLSLGAKGFRAVQPNSSSTTLFKVLKFLCDHLYLTTVTFLGPLANLLSFRAFRYTYGLSSMIIESTILNYIFTVSHFVVSYRIPQSKMIIDPSVNNYVPEDWLDRFLFCSGFGMFDVFCKTME